MKSNSSLRGKGITLFFLRLESFGIGLGLGMILGTGSGGEREIWMPASIFIFTGLGFVVANILGNKMRKQYKPNEV